VGLSGDRRALGGNGLPVDTPTGEYPISESSEAYEYDRNPNSQGHPQEGDQYHYHWISTCLTEDDPTDEHSHG